MMRKKLGKFLFVLMLSVPVMACGVKPDSMEPPPGAEDTPFPRTYPTALEK